MKLFSLIYIQWEYVFISQNYMIQYNPGIELFQIECYGVEPTINENSYKELCEYMRRFTVGYMKDHQSYEMKSNGLMLLLISNLMENYAKRIENYAKRIENKTQ